MAVEKNRQFSPKMFSATQISETEAVLAEQPAISEDVAEDAPEQREWWRTIRHWPSNRFYLRLNLETVLYAAIILFAIFTRLWDLDFRALHHDEGVHAYYSWRLYNGGGYEQEPWKHGPFLYHITALTFWLFGPSDFTARLPAALFGVLICLLPLMLRRELGRWGALTASFLLAISPTFLYFSRFIREDIFMAFATLLLFAGLVRFVRQPSAKWWYVTFAALGLLFCTKEASYFYTVLFFGFVFMWMCWQIAPRLVFIFTAYFLVAVFAFFFVAGLYTPPPIPFEQLSGKAISDYIGQLVVHPIFFTTIFLIGLGLVIGWLAFREAALARRDFLVATNRAAPGIAATKTLFLPYEPGSPAYAVGWLGRHWRVVGFGLLIFFGIYSVFFTGFFSSPVQGELGLISGLWYWMAQQGVERGGQPWYYYLFLMPLYEPLALLFGTLGGFFAIFQFARYNRQSRTRKVLVPVEETEAASVLTQSEDEDELDDLEPFAAPIAKPKAQNQQWVEVEVPAQSNGNSLWPGKRRREEHPYFVPLLLTAWAFGGLLFYTWASEKMPWLVIQVALPFILLTAYLFRYVWQGIERYFFSGEARNFIFGRIQSRAAFWTLAGAITFTIFLGYMVGLFLTSATLRVSTNGYQYEWLLIWVPALLMLLFWGLAGLVLGGRTALYATLGVTFALLSLFLLRTGFAFSYQQGDIPVEMGIYTQTAPDLQRTVKQLDNAIRMTNDQYRTPVLYDDELRTPMDFYLRDFLNKKKTADFSPQGLQTAGIANLNDYPFIMLTDGKRDNMDDNQKRLLDTNYTAYHRVFRWWFAEEPYRNFDLSDNTRISFLKNKASKVSAADASGKVIVRQGEVMSEDRLKEARDAKGHVLERLYSGNGGNNLALNLSEAARSGGNLANPQDFSRLWRFVFFREQVQPLGHFDFTLYVRNDTVGLFRQFGDLVPYPISQP